MGTVQTALAGKMALGRMMGWRLDGTKHAGSRPLNFVIITLIALKRIILQL